MSEEKQTPVGLIVAIVAVIAVIALVVSSKNQQAAEIEAEQAAEIEAEKAAVIREMKNAIALENVELQERKTVKLEIHRKYPNRFKKAFKSVTISSITKYCEME